jgi:glycosyltransferase involved in cell wall biosynthesis
MRALDSELTVIVPTYNQAQFLESRIRSILGQTIIPASIIVIDDCSEKPYLEDFEYLGGGEVRIEYIRNESRNGIATKTWLQGVNLVETKYVWIAEGDDLSEPNFIESILGEMRNKDLSFATCQSLNLDNETSIVSSSNHKNIFPNLNTNNEYISSYGEVQKSFFFLGNPIENVSSCIFKTSSVLYALKKSRHISPLTCDWEVYLNFQHSDTFGYFPKYLNIFRNHSESQRSKTTLEQAQDQIVELIFYVLQLLNAI